MIMWSFGAPAPFLGLAAIALLPCASAKPYPVHLEELRERHNATQLEARANCAGTPCGWENWLCCPSGSTCGTNANNEAQCNAGGESGSWQFMTSTWVDTLAVTKTSVYSSWVGANPTAASCLGTQSPCNGKCCDSGYYCFNWDQATCKIIGGSSSAGVIATGTVTPGAPLRPTSSGLIVITATATGGPTATVPFSTPISTGVDGTAPEQTEPGGGGLSGGAIAGIVVGVIVGLLLLLLLCMFCCAKAAFDAIAAILGFGKKKKHTHEETYIEEHHHSSGGGAAAAAGGRRWYGQPSRPNKAPKKSGGGWGGALGIGAALGGIALALGMKRKHDKQRHDDKSTTISSAYYSDYTSSSSASSSDRHTRPIRNSSRR